jgi:hypothetical protein
MVVLLLSAGTVKKLVCCQHFRGPYCLYHQGWSEECSEVTNVHQNRRWKKDPQFFICYNGRNIKYTWNCLRTKYITKDQQPKVNRLRTDHFYCVLKNYHLFHTLLYCFLYIFTIQGGCFAAVLQQGLSSMCWLL